MFFFFLKEAVTERFNVQAVFHILIFSQKYALNKV